MKKEWSTLWSNKVYLAVWISYLLLVLANIKLVSAFLVFNESRHGGFLLNDWVLNMIEPSNVSTLLFAITWVCIFFSLPIALRTPRRAMVFFISILILGISRCICLYVLPLTPPEGIIPLRDTFIEGSFYGDQVLVRDLFFSGHTASLALLTFIVDVKWIKYILGVCTLIVAILLLKQHVHYTLDVVVAPLAAFLAYRLAKAAEFSIYNKIHSLYSVKHNAVETA